MARSTTLSVVLLYSLGPFLGPQNPSLLLLIHALLVIIFTCIQIRIMPFEKAIFGTCNQNECCSMYTLNLLDLFYLLNYTLLALIVSYLLTKDTNVVVPLQVVVGVLVGLSIIVFCCTIFLLACRACKVTTSEDTLIPSFEFQVNYDAADTYRGD